jgi:hypothetical protein
MPILVIMKSQTAQSHSTWQVVRRTRWIHVSSLCATLLLGTPTLMVSRLYRLSSLAVSRLNGIPPHSSHMT